MTPTSDQSENEILVSIIIPTYNRPLLARRAVVSALAQTIENIEIIVVDDNSDISFKVKEVINSIDDKRVKYIAHTHSRGPSPTRNTGIDMATGKYIALLDDDDIWFEDKIERQLISINNTEASICSFASQKGINKRIGLKNIGLKELRKNRDWAICSGLIILTQLMKKIKFDEEIRVGEDMDLLFRVLKKSPISYLDEVLFIVNAGEHNRITNEGEGSQEVLEKRLRFIEKNMDSYGQYWGNINTAMILLRGIENCDNKFNYINSVYKRCGFFPTSHVVLIKAKNKLIGFYKL